MSLLLDTHALVWWLLDAKRLSKDAYDYIRGGDQRLFVSAASVYEIEDKRDRDASLYRFPRNIPASVPLLGFEWLPIEAEDGFRAARLACPTGTRGTGSSRLRLGVGDWV